MNQNKRGPNGYRDGSGRPPKRGRPIGSPHHASSSRVNCTTTGSSSNSRNSNSSSGQQSLSSTSPSASSSADTTNPNIGVPGYMGELPGFFFDRERGKYFHITKKTPTEVIQQLAAKEDADLRMQTQQQLNRTRPKSVLPFLLSRGILAGNNQNASEAAVERTLLWSIPSRARVYMPLQSTGYRNRMAVDPSGMVAICNGPRLTVNAQPMLALSPHLSIRSLIAAHSSSSPAFAFISSPETADEETGWLQRVSMSESGEECMCELISSGVQNVLHCASSIDAKDTLLFVSSVGLHMQRRGLDQHMLLCGFQGLSCCCYSSTEAMQVAYAGSRKGHVVRCDYREPFAAKRAVLSSLKQQFAMLNIMPVPTQQQLVSLSAEGKVSLLDLRMGKQLFEYDAKLLEGRPSVVSDLHVSSSGRTVYVGRQQYGVAAYDAQSGSLLRSWSTGLCDAFCVKSEPLSGAPLSLLVASEGRVDLYSM